MEPAIESLLDKVDSKYTMVTVAAKRARLLMEGARRHVDGASDKPVTIALQELATGALQFQRTKTGIK
jgi:DNA-directed RNA polymerase subunit omega